MKVLQVHARYRGRGGEDTTVENERELLERAGHTVRLFEGRNSETTRGAVSQLIRAPWNSRAAAALKRELEAFGPDVVHVHNTWFALSPSVLAAASRAGVPVVMTAQNYRLVCVSANLFRDGGFCEDCVGRSPWPGIRHRCYRDSAAASGIVATSIVAHRAARTWERHPDVVVAVSRFGVDRHVAGGVPRERIVVKDNFVPDPGPRPAPPSASDEVLFVGRPAPEKGLDLLLAAWRAAAPVDLRLTVIGERREESVPGVRYLGPLEPERVAERMQRARALVMPSQWPEGQPLALLEALACGLPVAGTAIGGIEEVIGELPGAPRVPLGERSGWEEALTALGDDAAVDGLGGRSRDLYERRFSTAVALDNLLDVYRLAGERRQRALRR